LSPTPFLEKPPFWKIYSAMSASSTSSLGSIPNPCTANTPREWTVQEIRDLVQKKFGKRPCWYQVKTALALYAGKDVIGCAPTGAGKTLSFWIPLLMALEDSRDAMTIVVTPLNLLGKQNEVLLEKAGISLHFERPTSQFDQTSLEQSSWCQE
jgi:superfamily II DNA/RNA helicase